MNWKKIRFMSFKEGVRFTYLDTYKYSGENPPFIARLIIFLFGGENKIKESYFSMLDELYALNTIEELREAIDNVPPGMIRYRLREKLEVLEGK